MKLPYIYKILNAFAHSLRPHFKRLYLKSDCFQHHEENTF